MLSELYKNHCERASDINELLPILKEYASKVDRVTEFGVRTGCSTVAFLNSSAKQVVSYDIDDCEVAHYLKTLAPDRFTFIREDTSKIFNIAETDMLFIDTLHTYEQVKNLQYHVAQRSLCNQGLLLRLLQKLEHFFVG